MANAQMSSERGPGTFWDPGQVSPPMGPEIINAYNMNINAGVTPVMWEQSSLEDGTHVTVSTPNIAAATANDMNTLIRPMNATV